jgi:hypothetical protein
MTLEEVKHNAKSLYLGFEPKKGFKNIYEVFDHTNGGYKLGEVELQDNEWTIRNQEQLDKSNVYVLNLLINTPET